MQHVHPQRRAFSSGSKNPGLRPRRLALLACLTTIACLHAASQAGGGFMLRSGRDPGLAINAWGGARDGGELRLHNGCNAANPDCTWSYVGGALVSDRESRDGPLVITAWGGAAFGAELRLSRNCRAPDPNCTWSYRNGMFVSNRDPSLAINAWGGARHGTLLKLHNQCRPDNGDCTWAR